jgi:formate dehydrogenase subunit delta
MAATSVDKLTMMANQIALFFRSYPHDEAVAGIARHLRNFWTPKMRTMLTEVRLTQKGLEPLVAEALVFKPKAESPTSKEAAGPGQVGALGAVDAG